MQCSAQEGMHSVSISTGTNGTARMYKTGEIFPPQEDESFCKISKLLPRELSEKVRLCFPSKLFEYCRKSRRKLMFLQQLNVEREGG